LDRLTGSKRTTKLGTPRSQPFAFDEERPGVLWCADHRGGGIVEISRMVVCKYGTIASDQICCRVVRNKYSKIVKFQQVATASSVIDCPLCRERSIECDCSLQSRAEAWSNPPLQPAWAATNQSLSRLRDVVHHGKIYMRLCTDEKRSIEWQCEFHQTYGIGNRKGNFLRAIYVQTIVGTNCERPLLAAKAPHKMRNDRFVRPRRLAPQRKSRAKVARNVSGKSIGQTSNYSITATDSGMACSVCRRVFATKSNLRRHMRGVHHIDNRGRDGMVLETRCAICGQTFSQRSNLKRHMEGVHSTSKPYRCDYCFASYLNQEQLTRHTQSCHR